MAVITSQKITVYYERFKSIDVTFTKEIVMVTGLITNQVYLKCVGDFWPCVIFSSSFEETKIVVNLKSGVLQKLERANQMASLRFCFKSPDTGNPVTFFVNTKVLGYTSYGGSKDVALFRLQFTQRPPDDLIEIMGRILDANVNSAKRREERIPITPDSARRLKLLAKDCAIFIQGVPRRCIMRDISFSGAKLIMMGVAKFLVEKNVAIRLDFEDPRESFLIRGKFIRSEIVEGRKDLVALVVLYEEPLVPMGYKIRLNDYLGQVRAAERTGGADESPPSPEKKPPAQAPEEPKAPPPAANKAGSEAPQPAVNKAAAQATPAPKAPPAAQAAPVTPPPAEAPPAGGASTADTPPPEDFDLKL